MNVLLAMLAAGAAAAAVWLWAAPWESMRRLAGCYEKPAGPVTAPAAREPGRGTLRTRDSPAAKGTDPPAAHRAGRLHAAPGPRSRRSADRSGRRMKDGRGAKARRETLTVLVAAFGGLLCTGGPPGLMLGAGIGVVMVLIRRRREPVGLRRRRQRITADLPYALDLMVACLRAGQPVSGAVEAAAEAIGGPLGEGLAWVNGQLRLGARPEAAWRALEADRPLAALARGMTRAELSGAPVAEVLARLADEARREARATSSAAARRVGVQVVAPLGLCFLPAFVCLGIVPVVAGLAEQVFHP